MDKNNNQYSKKTDSYGEDPGNKILHRASGLKLPAGKSREEAFALLQERIAANERKTVKTVKSRHRFLYSAVSAAAGLLMLAGIWQIWFSNQITQVMSEKGSHKEYHLPDGSMVTLNAESRISFNKRNFMEKRRIDLDGEAFFEVTPGSPFSVITANGDVRVLGTTFNVFTRTSSFKVSCITGKVEVSNENQSVIITPGESAKLTGKQLVTSSENHINTVTGWMNGEFYFEDSPLKDVFEEIGRQFNVNFTATKFEGKLFTGSFTNKDLNTALDIVCIPMNLEYEIGSNGKISVSESGHK